MITKILFKIVFPALLLAPTLAEAGTIPAGTTLTVRTQETIRSVDAPGTRFSAQLVNNITVKGKTMLRAGTEVSGKVVTSRRLYGSSQRLTVDIIEITVSGRKLPIKTTGAVQLDNTNFKTKNDRYVSRGGYAVGAGRVIQFQLAQPLNF